MRTLSNKHKAAPAIAGNHPYARLYQAVVLLAVHDLTQKEHQDEAREWILSSESDYAFTAAGISPYTIRQLMV